MENRDDDSSTLLLSILILIVFLIAVAFGIRYTFNEFSVSLIRIAHAWLEWLPSQARGILFTSYQQELIYKLHSQSIYRAIPSATFSRVSAFITMFQWPIFLFILRRFYKYRLRTLPYTFHEHNDQTKSFPRLMKRFVIRLLTFNLIRPKAEAKSTDIQINDLTDLMRAKQDKYPQVKLAYEYQSAHLENDFDQRWGRFSMEEGPIRWCIKRGLVSFGGERLGFTEFQAAGLRVEDDINALSKYAGKLDININKLASSLKEQLGKPFNGPDSLCDEYVALAVLFLLYSKGIEHKNEALRYKSMLATSCQIDNVGHKRKKEEWRFSYNRKVGLKRLKALLVEANSKLIDACRTDYQFILSCYHFARTKNGDITPPDIQWLMYFNRELYLLLHCYNGSPKAFNNSPYIEVCAPFNSWALLWAAVEKDESNAASNKYGAINSHYNWQNLFAMVCLKVINGKHRDKSGQLNLFVSKNVSADLEKALSSKRGNNIDDTTLTLIEKSKSIAKLKLSKKDYIAIRDTLPNFPRSYLSHQMMILYIECFDILSAEDPHSVRQFIRELSWLSRVDNALYLQMVTMYFLMSESELSAKNILKWIIAGVDATTELTTKTVTKLNHTYVQVPFEGLVFETYDHEDEDETDIYHGDPNYAPLESGFLDLILYAQTLTESSYSSEQLLNLASSDWYSVRQSIKSILFFMTNTERWLLEKYHLDQESMLGSPSVEIEYINIG